jgi:hypothetical protein
VRQADVPVHRREALPPLEQQERARRVHVLVVAVLDAPRLEQGRGLHLHRHVLHGASTAGLHRDVDEQHERGLPHADPFQALQGLGGSRLGRLLRGQGGRVGGAVARRSLGGGAVHAGAGGFDQKRGDRVGESSGMRRLEVLGERGAVRPIAKKHEAVGLLGVLEEAVEGRAVLAGGIARRHDRQLDELGLLVRRHDVLAAGRERRRPTLGSFKAGGGGHGGLRVGGGGHERQRRQRRSRAEEGSTGGHAELHGCGRHGWPPWVSGVPVVSVIA